MDALRSPSLAHQFGWITGLLSSLLYPHWSRGGPLTAQPPIAYRKRRHCFNVKGQDALDGISGSGLAS